MHTYPTIISQARSYVLNLLQDVDHYPYHNIDHTIGVYLRTLYLCICENIGEEDREDLLLAALFHDTGFTKMYKNNEAAGADIAKNWLREHDWSADRIAKIERLILATKFPEQEHQLFHTPIDILEMIIQDADMDNLGRSDAFYQSRAIFEEVRSFGGSAATWKQFQNNNIHVLEQYHFHTKTARSERSYQKNVNLQTLIDEIHTIKKEA